MLTGIFLSQRESMCILHYVLNFKKLSCLQNPTNAHAEMIPMCSIADPMQTTVIKESSFAGSEQHAHFGSEQW